MLRYLLVFALSLTPVIGSADFSCPDGTQAACLETGDKVCAGSTRCVDENAVCFDDFPCDPNGGFVCTAEYDSALNEHRRSTEQYDQLVVENVDLRQQRLDRKNCVLNAADLSQAQNCVR